MRELLGWLVTRRDRGARNMPRAMTPKVEVLQSTNYLKAEVGFPPTVTEGQQYLKFFVE